jgi:hypothetical protein
LDVISLELPSSSVFISPGSDLSFSQHVPFNLYLNQHPGFESPPASAPESIRKK